MFYDAFHSTDRRLSIELGKPVVQCINEEVHSYNCKVLNANFVGKYKCTFKYLNI